MADMRRDCCSYLCEGTERRGGVCVCVAALHMKSLDALEASTPKLLAVPALIAAGILIRILLQTAFNVSLSPYLIVALCLILIWRMFATEKESGDSKQLTVRSLESKVPARTLEERQQAASHSTTLRQRRYRLTGQRKLYTGRMGARRDRIRAFNLGKAAAGSGVAEGMPASSSNAGQFVDEEFAISSPWKARKACSDAAAASELEERRVDLEFLFHIIDREDRGVITTRELQAVLCKGSPECLLTTNLKAQLSLFRSLGDTVSKDVFVSSLLQEYTQHGEASEFWKWIDLAPSEALRS